MFEILQCRHPDFMVARSCKNIGGVEWPDVVRTFKTSRLETEGGAWSILAELSNDAMAAQRELHKSLSE